MLTEEGIKIMMDSRVALPWRVEQAINIYDADGRPICQCHHEFDAVHIVTAVNQHAEAGALRDEVRRLKARVPEPVPVGELTREDLKEQVQNLMQTLARRETLVSEIEEVHRTCHSLAKRNVELETRLNQRQANVSAGDPEYQAQALANYKKQLAEALEENKRLKAGLVPRDYTDLRAEVTRQTGLARMLQEQLTTASRGYAAMNDEVKRLKIELRRRRSPGAPTMAAKKPAAKAAVHPRPAASRARTPGPSRRTPRA